MTIRKITGATSSLVARVSVVTGNRIFINKATVTQTNLLATVAQDAHVFKSNLILPGTVDHILYSDEGSSRFFRNLLYTADGSQLLISKNFFDPLDLIELVGRTTFVYNAQRKVDDALLTAEDIELIFASARRIFDDIVISDRPRNLLALQKADVFTMLDGGIRKYVNSTKRETITLGSGLAQRQSTLEKIAFLNTKLLRDTSNVDERKQLAVLQRKTDAVTIIDYRQTNYWLNKYFGDTAPALDLVGVFDGNIFSFIHLAVDALNISEDSRRVLTANRPVNDLLLSSEFKTLFINKPFTEQLLSTEVIRKLNLQNKFEDTPVLDLPRQLFIKPADNLAPARVTVTDVSQRLAALSRFETLTAAQTRFDFLYIKPVNEALSILDLIDGYTIAWTARRIFDELMTIAEQKAVILALRKNDTVAIGDLFGSALIKIRNEIDNITVAEILRRYMRMEKFETANIDDPKAMFFRQGTRLEDIAIGDVALIARVQGLFEFLTATDSRVILAILLGRNETVPVPDTNFYLLSKRLGDASAMLDFAATGDGAEFKFLQRTNDVLTILDFIDDTRLVFRARRTFREGIFPDDYFARNFWINKTADAAVPAVVTIGSGLNQRQRQLENISFVDLKTADAAVPAVVTIGSGLNQRQSNLELISFIGLKTADAAVPVTVALGSGFDQRQSNLELISFIGLKTADAAVPATVALGSGIDQRQSQLENIAFIALKTADAVVPAEVVMDDYRTSNLWINKGLQDSTTMLDLTGISDGLNYLWIDQEADAFFAHSYAQPATTYIRQPRDGNLSDVTVPTDYFSRNFWINKTADAAVPATVIMTDYKAQRLFTYLVKFDFSEPIDVFRRLTRTFLNPTDGLRQDFTPALDTSAFSPYPARLLLMPARLGVVQTFSPAGYLTSIVTTADTKNHPVYVGQQYTGAYRAGDRLETINNWVNIDAKQGANNALLLKTADGANNSQFSSVTVTYTPRDRDQVGTVDFFTNQIQFVRRGLTDVTNNDTGFQPIIVFGSGIDQRQSNLERVSFTSLIRAKLDQGTFDRFDPAPALDNSTFSPYPARVVLLDAKQGANNAVSGTTVTARDRDRLFVGQQYGAIRFSGDPMERISFLATKLLGDVTAMLDLTNVFDGITYTSILIEREQLALGSGLNQRQSDLERISFTSLLRAKAGVTYAVSGTTVTAPSTDRLFVGQQYGTRRLSGDPMEAMAHVVLKTALVTAGAGFYGPGSGVSVRAGTNQDPVWIGSAGTQTYAAVASNSSGSITIRFPGLLTPKSYGYGTQYARIWLRRPIGYTSSVVLRYTLDENWYVNGDGGGGGGALTVTTSIAVTSTWAQYTVAADIQGWLTAAGFDPNVFDPGNPIYAVNDNSIYIETPNTNFGYDEIEVFAPWMTNNSSVSYVATFGTNVANNEVLNSSFFAATTGSVYNDFVQPPAAFASAFLDQTRLAGPGRRLEQLRYTGIKRLFDFSQAGSGIDQRQTDLERIRFTSLLRIHQDQGTFDRFDPAPALDNSTFSPFPARTLLLDAKQGAVTAVSGTTVTARDGDRLFVGQRYGTIRFSGDPMERISFLATKLIGDITTAIDLANVFDGITYTSILIEREFLTLGSGLNQRASNLELVSFTSLLSAGQGVNNTVSGTTVTARDGDRLFVGQRYGTIRFSGDPQEALAFVTLKNTGIGGAGSSLSIVTLGSGLNQRQSNLENISFYDIKRLFDVPQAGSGFDQRSTDLERISFTKLLRVHQDSGTFDRFDPAQPIDQPFKFLNLTAKRGVTGPVLLNTIDPNPDVEFQQSSVTITRTAQDLDEVGSLDFFNLTLITNRLIQDSVLIGSGIDQRQSTLERISFIMLKLIGDVQSMIDIQSLSDGLTFSYLANETDSFSLGPAADQTYPARVKSGNAENIAFITLKTTGQGGAGSSLSIVTLGSGLNQRQSNLERISYIGNKALFDFPQAGSGIDQRQSDLERISFTSLIRAELDQGSRDRFDPVIAGSVIQGIRVAGNSLENLAMSVLLDAKQGVNTAVSGTTVTARDRDRLFVGQQYGTIRFSGDPLERISFLATKLLGDVATAIDLANVFDGITYTSIVLQRDFLTLGSGIDQRQNTLESIPFTVLLSAKQGANTTVSGTTVTARDGDRLFVGQRYGNIRFSGDALENIGIVNLLTAKRGQNGTVFTQTIDDNNSARTSVLVSYGSYGDDAVGTLDFRTDVVNYVRQPHHGFADIPGIGDDSANSTFPARSLRKVIQPREFATNLITSSESLVFTNDGGNWVYSGSGGLIVSNDAVTAPDGSLTADRMSGGPVWLQQSVSSNTTYTWSWYAQVTDDRLNSFGSITPLYYRIEGNVSGVRVSDTLYSNTFTPFAWNRVSVTFTTGPSDTTVYLYPYGSPYQGWLAYYWGWQLNPGTAADAYIRTTSAAIVGGVVGLTNFVAPTDTGARSNFVNISARRGVSGTLQFSTIGNNVENTISSVTIVQTLRDPDAVGIVDFFALLGTAKNFYFDAVVIGSGLDQRQSTLERVSFVILTRIKTDNGLGLTLDPVTILDRSGLTPQKRISSTAVVVGTTSGTRIAGNPRENISFTNLLAAKRGQNGTVFTQTMDGNNSARTSVSVIAGSYGDDSVGTLDFRSDVVNYFRAPHYGFDDYYVAANSDRPYLTLLLRAKLDQGSKDRFDPIQIGSGILGNRVAGNSLENLTMTMLLDAKRGVQGTVLLNTIDPSPDVEFQQSSVTVTYGSRQPDSVGTLDFFSLFYATNRFLQDNLLIGSGIDQRQSTLERINFLMLKLIGDTVPMLDLVGVFDGNIFTSLVYKADITAATDNSAFSPYPARLLLLPARLGVNQAFSSVTVTADTKNHPVYVGTQIAANRRDVLENTFFTLLKAADNSDRDTAISIVVVTDPARPPQVVLKRAVQDSGTFDRFDPAPVLDTSTFSPFPQRLMLLDAKRALTGNVELKTIDSFGDNAYSSVQITYTSRDRDIVGSIDRALLTFTAGRILQELVTIGSGIDQRHIAGLERTTFFIDKRFDENQAYGQGQNLGPLMLDNFSFNDGLTFTYLQQETDAFTPGDNSASSPFPQRLMIMSARLGINQAFSSTTVTADTKNHPVWIGTNIAANRKDVLENTFYTMLKVADNSDRSTAISIVTLLDQARPPQIFQKRAVQDSGTFDRFDPAPVLDTSTFSPFPARVMLLDAKRGLTGNVELKTIDMPGDNAYSSVQITYTSRDRDIIGSIDRATLLLTTTRLFQELITIGSGLNQRQNDLERTSFFIGMKFDENQVYGQGQNLGPLMLDDFSFNDGLTFTYLQRETDAVTAGTGIAIRVSGTQAENISFVKLLTAKAGALTTVSSVNNTAASTDRLFVGQQYGSIRFSGDRLERLFYTMLAPKTDAATADERPFQLLLKLATDDQTKQRTHAVTIGTSSLGIRVSGQTLENISIQWLKTARRGVAGGVSFSTIGQTEENTISSVTVVRTADSLGDEVGALDSFTIGYGFGGVQRAFFDLISIGSNIDQRQSTLERVSFFINKRFDENQAYGQGQNLGPLMLDDFSFNDGLTFTYLQRETDAAPALDNSAFSPFPARLMIMSARRGVATTISSVTTTADAKNDPVYIGTNIAANRRDVLENTFFTLLKAADNGDRSTAISVVVMGSGFDQRQDTLENIRFTSLLRANALADRNDPIPALDNSTFSPYPARAMLLDAKRGLTAAVELKTIDAPGDNAFSSVLVTYTSRDRDIVGSLDRASLTFTAGRILQELVTIGSDNGFRFQSTQTSETVKFFIDKRFDENQAYGQGQNLGPLMLDNFSFNDGLTFVYLQRETDATSSLDTSAFSPFPARLMIMAARRGLTVANSGITVTADTKNDPAYVGTQITGTRYLAGDGLETLRNYLIKVADNGDRDTAISIVSLLDANRLTVLKRATQDSGTFDRFDPVLALDNSTFSPYPARLLLLDAKRGTQSTTELKTIDGIGNSPFSSVQVTYGSRERDVVGIVDLYNSTFFNGKSNFETVTIGSDNGFRFQSLQSSETVKFFINKRFDENQVYGQGQNLGPLMLDAFSFNDGLTFTYLQRETDATSSLDTSAFSPFPARFMLMPARRGLVTAVSGTTVTADTKDDPVYAGTRITGTRYLAGDGLETFRNYLIKVADNGDRDTAISTVAALDADRLTVLLRAKLDQNSYDRFDPVTAGSGILGIRVSNNQLENMNMLMLKSAKAGLQSTVSGTTVTALGGDRLFVGQQYGSIRFAGDPMERIGLVTLKTTGIGGGGTSFSTVASTDVIRPAARYFLNNAVGQTFDAAVLDEQKAINNYKPLGETSAVSDESQVRDVQKSVLGDPNDINIVSSGGSLRNTSYADISYFAEDYVGDSRSIF